MIETFLFVRLGEGEVVERSLEATEVLRGGGRRWCKHEAGLHIFGRKIRNIHLACLLLSLC